MLKRLDIKKIRQKKHDTDCFINVMLFYYVFINS